MSIYMNVIQKERGREREREKREREWVCERRETESVRKREAKHFESTSGSTEASRLQLQCARLRHWGIALTSPVRTARGVKSICSFFFCPFQGYRGGEGAVCAREELRVELVDFSVSFFPFFLLCSFFFFRLPRGAVRLVVVAWQELRTELVDADAARSFLFVYFFFYITFLFVRLFSCFIKVCVLLSSYISMYL